LALLAGLGLSLEAQADPVLRFPVAGDPVAVPGRVVATGNTLGLSKALDYTNRPGLDDSIGTFICLDDQSVDDLPDDGDPHWPLGTSYDWQQNGSTAVLDLPPGAEVLYAELLWGGSYMFGETGGGGFDDVQDNLDDPITLSVGGQSETVSPDPATAVTIHEYHAKSRNDRAFWANYYLRSGEVTDFVQQNGGGTYSASSVPATQDHNILDLAAAGWTLVVAYRDEEEPTRNLSIFVGGPWVDENAVQDYEVSGFCAPPFGAVEGRVVVSALEGDANRDGDELAIFSEAQQEFVELSGPNNPVDNFFGSQVNDSDGELDEQGSFGDANHDPFTRTHVVGGRQGWDVTTVVVTSAQSHLANDQQTATLRTSTADDSYVPTLVALEIDVKSPDFSGAESTTEASASQVALGDGFTVTATLGNGGEALANNLSLVMPLDVGLELTEFTLDGTSGDVDGNPVTKADLSTGVAVGNLAVGDSLEVVASLHVAGPPTNGLSFQFMPTWAHSFEMCGGTTVSASFSSDQVAVSYDDGGAGGAGGAGAFGGSGPVGGAGGEGEGASSGLSDDTEADSGCGCATPGEQAPLRQAGLAGLLLLAAGLVARRRRHRSQ